MHAYVDINAKAVPLHATKASGRRGAPTHCRPWH
jgi:hypothetical protein